MKNEDYENDYMQNLVDRMNAELNDSGVTVSFEPLNVYDEDDENAEDFSCYSLGDGTAMISEYYGNKKEVNIPERINGLKIVGIKTFAFPDNDNVDIINIPKSIEFIDVSAFPEVVEFNVDKDNLNYTSCDGVIYNKEMTSLVRYPARNKRNEFVVPESVKTIEGLSFIHANHLKKLYLSQNIKKFNKCVFGSFDKIDDIYYEGTESDWKKVVIEDGNNCLDGKHFDQSVIHFNHKELIGTKNKSVTNEVINNDKNQKKADTNDYTYTLFKKGTAKIKKYKGREDNVVVPSKIDGYLVTSIGIGAFKKNKYIKSITIPGEITDICSEVFLGCENLKNVTILEGVVSIGNHVFSECNSLEVVNIPGSVKSIGRNNFYNCDAIKNIVVADSNKRYCSEDGVLLDKDKMHLYKYPVGNERVSYNVPEGVRFIIQPAFCHSKFLEKVTLPDSLISIDEYAFKECERLETIKIPKNIYKIEDFTFFKCDNISNIYFDGTKSEWENISFGSGNDCLENANVYFSKEDENTTNLSSKTVSATIKNDINENTVSLTPTPKETEVIPSLKRAFVIVDRIDLLKNRLLNEARGEYYDTVLNSMNLLDDVTATVKTIKDISEDEEMLLDFIRNNDIEILANIEENMRDVYNQMQELYDKYSPLWKESNNQKTSSFENDAGTASSSSDTNSGGCYIATCVYGSYDCPEVWTLRRFRDYTLAKTWHGRAFIHTYYALAPTLVKLFGNTKWFNAVWQSMLDKKIQKLNDDGVENTPYQDRKW